ncbi:glycosyltransferase family 2 protein [Candidatus Daviesbacteria bacterium]|nr:glycosyltransferase family 2 protein [Candidatus Daviesbacteria bacterium]
MKNDLKQMAGVSLIIPVLDEEKTLTDIISKCSKETVVKQLVIVNDGSTDKTKNILDRLSSENKNSRPLITVTHHSKNLGKGAAIKTGLTRVLGKYVMVQDADLEYSPDEIKYLFNEAKKENRIVFGTRSHHKKKGYLLAQLGNWYLNVMFNLLFGYSLTDSYTCYKLIPQTIWKKMNLVSNGFEIDAELISKLGVNGYKIKEIPISYFPRKYSEGKKIKWLDLFKATAVALRIRFSHL